MDHTRFTFHLIGNSHLDPVWLWDWREGLNEGLITVRTILELMEEFPEMTYIRGETAIYEHIERHDPASFAKIQRHIKDGRWDYVGGTYIQPDTNMTGTETMARHFTRGQRYFKERFGKPVEVAWAADSFGHSAGMPSVFSQAGIRYFAFFRPSAKTFPLASPAFRWRGADGSAVLAYRPIDGWYGIERDAMPLRLDTYLEKAPHSPFRNVAIFYGLGNHGGGPSRRHLQEIRDWTRKHPEVEVVHSGLHRFFGALEKEIAGASLPEVKGEMNFFARGCYSAAAKFKFKYRRAEAGLVSAEKTSSAIAAGLGIKAPETKELWNGVLFNSFHDILPGSSIERAIDEQISWVEGIIHGGKKIEFEALNSLAEKIDVPARPSLEDHPQPVTMLVWNPHPYAYRGPLEIEAALDYRPIFAYQNSPEKVPIEVRDSAGKVVPFQVIAPEYKFILQLPWRKRVLIDADLPALGWATYSIGWVEGAKTAAFQEAPASAPGRNEIAGAGFKIRARKGAAGIQMELNGKPLFSGAGFGLQTLEDPWGPWGDHYEEPEAEDISKVLETWKVTEVEVLEKGPLRSTLWVRFEDSASRVELTLHLHHSRGTIEAQARVFWNRPAARLKMVMPGVGREAEYEVLGGTVRRGAMKEVPGGRWVRVFGPERTFGFASDALYNYDLKGDTLRATIVRSSRYTSDVPETLELPKHFPVIDRGEYRFNFLLTADAASLPAFARELEAPSITLPIPNQKGALPPRGSFALLKNANLQLLALKPAENGRGWIVRLQEIGHRKTKPVLQWLGANLSLEEMPKNSIATYLLVKKGTAWSGTKVGLSEVK
jgi:alpha-mannosidase